MQSKGDPTRPNEDALFARDEGDRVMVAVADAHFGIEASHAWIRAVAGLDEIPHDLDELETRLRLEAQDATPSRSSTTLLVAIMDRNKGAGFGVSVGDSSLVIVGPGGARRINRREARYLDVDPLESMGASPAHPFGFRTRPDQLLLAFSDGVDECHYRSPRSSVTLEHLARLHSECGAQAAAYCDALSRWALEGVDGNPGGQDNIALVVSEAGRR